MTPNESAEVFSRLGALEEGQRHMRRSLDKIGNQLDHLVSTQHVLRGAWRTVVIVSGVVASVVGWFVPWLRGP